ncbi:M15 family metallopeptidase [Thermostichus vulcanus]|uniref:D-alanyl-D-alanine carboxypeptidase family protein n=1 Tax=Thermostichus vulcanus str. 'Rupite' TaxID=2813851 RepID=A0ABT0C987_THEVL|nr:M15 family metallopeptidase [Thermostichus vulcanus]MCJ2542344.1 D-alanyl-D-alanine carboxypeptidase family protein [Thermostichus vulcanus str. 'Rupite']
MNDDIPVARRQPTQAGRKQGLGFSWRLWLRLGLGLLLLGILSWVGWGLWELWDSSKMVDPVAVEAPIQSIFPLPQPTLQDSRVSLLGHFAYAEAPLDSLQAVGSYHGREIHLRQAAAESYRRMNEAAQAAGIRLVPISGFRSIADQEFLFFQLAQSRALRPEERAAVSAPPGYSEHHTGYAIDIGDAGFPQFDTKEEFETTPAFRWLESHAARFGFELSFPRGNPQGVSYEPWHWRFVGDRDSLETFYTR